MQHLPSGGVKTSCNVIRCDVKRLPHAVWTGTSFQQLTLAVSVVHAIMA